jgi:cell division protein FtsB
MKLAKRMIVRGLLVAEVIVFAWTYVYGTQGLCHVWACHKENEVLESQIVALQTDISRIEQELHAWNTNPFYKEKIAREQLQMAREGDTIYYLQS